MNAQPFAREQNTIPKYKSARAKSQARSKRIRANNARIKKQAKILVKEGLIARPKIKDIQAKIKTGAKGLSYSQKKQRSEITKLFRTLGGFLVGSDYKPLPKERKITTKKIPPEIVEKIKSQGFTVVKTSKGYIAIKKNNQTITKRGEVIEREDNTTTRGITLKPELFVSGSNGVAEWHKLVTKKFQQAKRSKSDVVYFSFGANVEKGMIYDKLQFHSPQELIEHLEVKYKDEQIAAAGGIKLTTYLETKKLRKEFTTYGLPLTKPKKHRKPKIMAELSPRQQEHRRNLARIRYARQRTAKGKNLENN